MSDPVKSSQNATADDHAADAKPTDKGIPSPPPEGGLEKVAAAEGKLPRPGKAVEEKMGANMPDQK